MQLLKKQYLQLKNRSRRTLKPLRRRRSPALIQEEAGLHVGISAELADTARHAAGLMADKYQRWLERERHAAWGRYKRRHFTVAVGGGNTLKAQYGALVEYHHSDIDWVQHVRFFFLEDSSGEDKWESPENSLVMNFIVPLARQLIRVHGLRELGKKFKLPVRADEDDLVEHMIHAMVQPINLAEVKKALDADKPALAMRLARKESDRYQLDIRNKLGATMGFHLIISGIGKNGTLGAFAPYTPELKLKDPGTVVLKQQSGALRVALNRGVLTNADCVSLIVAGSLKLRALGRFEMAEAADYEQTVMETPLRMLRETYKIAEKVYIFADEQALHFDETVFEYSEQGKTVSNKAETRSGEEPEGIHILLMHGFMGLFSFAGFLIRLPSAWTVSALHRGSVAKTLPKDSVFPHYARFLRKAILKNWRQGRPVPIAGHSIAGAISDHLLLSIIGDPEGPIPPYSALKGENKQLVDALRASGIIHLAAWAPSDTVHIAANIDNLIAHYRKQSELDYSGLDSTYTRNTDGRLRHTDASAVSHKDRLANLDRFLKTPAAKPMINGINALMRYLLNNKTVQQRMLNTNSPYILRLVGGRLLKTASFYGLCKEVNAALHDPALYQRRHLLALDIMLEYDIPFLSIIHEDDFLVSAGRHREEHNYLLTQRKKKEGVSREQNLQIPARLVILQRESDELPLDPLNPHLLIMSTSNEGNTMARKITAAMTRFVNENVARATARGDTAALTSVKTWQRQHRGPQRPNKRKAKVA